MKINMHVIVQLMSVTFVVLYLSFAEVIFLNELLYLKICIPAKSCCAFFVKGNVRALNWSITSYELSRRLFFVAELPDLKIYMYINTAIYY